MNKSNQFAQAVLRSPLVWGALATLGFYTLIEFKLLGSQLQPFVQRYCNDHWILQAEVGMFFIGVATLVLKLLEINGQSELPHEALLGARGAERQSLDEVDGLLARLANLPGRWQESWLVRRLRLALEHIQTQGSADKLDEQLTRLSEADADRAHSDYGFLRIIIWAIPILGFLGTVVGITMAIASLDPSALQKSMDSVVKGLGVAFDTTSLALTLALVLVVAQHFIAHGAERRLLEAIDARAAAELAGRFEQSIGGSDPQVAAVRRMADAVVKNSEQLVARQAEVWRSTIDAAHDRWSELTAVSGEQLKGALAESLTAGLQAHAQELATIEAEFAARNQQQWGQTQQTLVTAAEALRAQQAELGKQGQVLLQVVEATGQVARLEDGLNRNLAALAGAQNFNDTLLNLAAAVQLLNARLGQLLVPPPAIELGGKRKPLDRAA